ncbi:MAG: hypothetical protein FJ221_13290 [Lentisphaerae bacterium]|nr:hypothetical protein [Lentisphaerota bacterium]
MIRPFPAGAAATVRPILGSLVLLGVQGLEARAGDAAAAACRFACVDNGANRLLLVDPRAPSNGWSVAIPAGSRDLQRLEGGRLLVSHGNGCGIHDLRDGRCRWRIDGFSGVQSARHVPARDEIMLGAAAADAVEFHFLVRDGEGYRRGGRVVRATGVDPAFLRLVRFTPEGHVLFTGGAPYRVIEWDLEANREVWSAPLPGKGYVALRRADGTTVASTGGAVSVVELARDGSVVKTWLGEACRKPMRLDWISGFDPLPGGRMVVANWLGHGAHGTGPHVIEVDAAGRTVWSWEDHAAARQVTNLLILGDE